MPAISLASYSAIQQSQPSSSKRRLSPSALLFTTAHILWTIFIVKSTHLRKRYKTSLYILPKTDGGIWWRRMAGTKKKLANAEKRIAANISTLVLSRAPSLSADSRANFGVCAVPLY